jgi:hypothetical protein
MTGTAELRTALADLLSFAAAEEQALLAATAFRLDYDRGSPDRWAAVPAVAHNNQFKGQQAERLGCVLSRRVPSAHTRSTMPPPRSTRGIWPSRRTPCWRNAGGSAWS